MDAYLKTLSSGQKKPSFSGTALTGRDTSWRPHEQRSRLQSRQFWLWHAAQGLDYIILWCGLSTLALRYFFQKHLFSPGVVARYLSFASRVSVARYLHGHVHGWIRDHHKIPGVLFPVPVTLPWGTAACPGRDWRRSRERQIANPQWQTQVSVISYCDRVEVVC